MTTIQNAAHAVMSGLGWGGLILLVGVVLIGSLFHRVLSLPPDSRDHGRAVLAQLTDLIRVLRGGSRRHADQDAGTSTLVKLDDEGSGRDQAA